MIMIIVYVYPAYFHHELFHSIVYFHDDYDYFLFHFIPYWLSFPGTRTHLNPPPGVHAHWAEKGSYRLETMLETIKNLPNRKNPFTEQNYAIYALDDYAVHLMVRNIPYLFYFTYIHYKTN